MVSDPKLGAPPHPQHQSVSSVRSGISLFCSPSTKTDTEHILVRWRNDEPLSALSFAISFYEIGELAEVPLRSISFLTNCPWNCIAKRSEMASLRGFEAPARTARLWQHSTQVSSTWSKDFHSWVSGFSEGCCQVWPRWALVRLSWFTFRSFGKADIWRRMTDRLLVGPFDPLPWKRHPNLWGCGWFLFPRLITLTSEMRCLCFLLIMVAKIILSSGTSLSWQVCIQWLRLCLPMQALWIWSLTGELCRTYASGPKNQNIKQKQYCNRFTRDFKNGVHRKKS